MNAKWAIALALAAPALMSAGPASVAPDFSAVDSLEKAEALAAEGKLVPVLLFPAEFGGDERRENVVYVTPEAATAKAAVTQTLIRMVQADQINALDVTPAYKGKSFVPARIVVKADHKSKPASVFEAMVEVW